jgi:hypothetical protein
MSAVPAHILLPPDTLLTTLPRGVWFSAVGEPLTTSELDEAHGYVHALGLTDIAIQSASSWHDAKRITNANDWLRTWWQTEHNEERRLLAAASARYGNDTVMQRLTYIMEGSAELFFGPAAISSTRAGVADSSLERSAAGAASQSLHQFALASMMDESSEHFFAIKFRLFLAGRWPLSNNESANVRTFHIF